MPSLHRVADPDPAGLEPLPLGGPVVWLIVELWRRLRRRPAAPPDLDVSRLAGGPMLCSRSNRG